MTAPTVATEKKTLDPGVVYATRAGLESATNHLAYLREQLVKTNEGAESADFHGDHDPGTLHATTHARSIETEIESLGFILDNQRTVIVEDLDFVGIVWPGTEIAVEIDGKNRTLIILGPFDQRQDVHQEEIQSRIASYHSPLIQPLLGHQAGDKVVIPQLPNGKRDVGVTILSVAPWPPKTTKESPQPVA